MDLRLGAALLVGCLSAPLAAAQTPSYPNQPVRMIVPTSPGGVTDALRLEYDALAVKASACIECAACLRRCPFEVWVIGKMREAVDLFRAGEAVVAVDALSQRAMVDVRDQ